MIPEERERKYICPMITLALCLKALPHHDTGREPQTEPMVSLREGDHSSGRPKWPGFVEQSARHEGVRKRRSSRNLRGIPCSLGWALMCTWIGWNSTIWRKDHLSRKYKLKKIQELTYDQESLMFSLARVKRPHWIHRIFRGPGICQGS